MQYTVGVMQVSESEIQRDITVE